MLSGSKDIREKPKGSKRPLVRASVNCSLHTFARCSAAFYGTGVMSSLATPPVQSVPPVPSYIIPKVGRGTYVPTRANTFWRH